MSKAKPNTTPAPESPDPELDLVPAEFDAPSDAPADAPAAFDATEATIEEGKPTV